MGSLAFDSRSQTLTRLSKSIEFGYARLVYGH